MAEADRVESREDLAKKYRSNRIWVFRGAENGGEWGKAWGYQEESLDEGAVWAKGGESSEGGRDGILALKDDGEGNLNGVRKDLMKLTIGKAAPAMPAVQVGRKASGLSLFISSMKKYDVVLIPDNERFYLGDVRTGYIYLDAEHKEASEVEAARLESTRLLGEKFSGFRHVRLMKVFGPFERGGLSLDLRKALRVQYPVACLDKHKDEIMAIFCEAAGIPKIDTDEPSIGARTLSKVKMMEVSYPLRKDVSVSLKIPEDMTYDEAERLSLFARSLYYKR